VSGAPTRRPSLEGARAKLARATEHIGLLQASIDRGTPLVALRQKSEVDTRGQTVRVAAEIETVPALPASWSLLVGDAVQNIRASLDHLVYELIALETGSYWEQSQFPIATTASGYTGWRDKGTIKRLASHWTVIERYQPYAGSDPPTLADSLFEFLQLFSNRDKHRLLVPAAASIELNQSLSILIPSKDCRRTSPTTVNVGVLEPGAELVAETFLITGPDPRVWMSEHYTPLVCFPEVPTVGAGELLRMMQAKAARLVGEFESLF